MSESYDEGDKIDFLMDVLKRYDGYISSTNYKVALILSFLATVIIALSLRISTLDTALVPPLLSNLNLGFTLFTLVSSLLVIALLFRVVSPNTDSTTTYKSFIFFSDVASWGEGSEGYYRSVRDSNADFILKDLATQNHIVAKILHEKFKRLQTVSSLLYYLVIPSLMISLVLNICIGGLY